MTNKEQALAMFDEGFCCSQAVITPYVEQWGLDREHFLKLTDAFGGGIGGLANICGAVSAAIMLIGLKYGRTSASDLDARQKTRKMVKEFVKLYNERNGFIDCKNLLGVDISTGEGMAEAKEKGYFNSKCPGLIEDAVDILNSILD
ncbi:MAG: C-GCAxxG-C-C family protein [Acidobacteria bacterium]|jgi:C_GCAxxG_C_C family probable redox protein|nr:C-GCAxxG-C-C family protein [Acidobacteriota bacterium]